MATLPAWAKKVLHGSDAETIRAAVQEAERRTKGEFVVVLARRSSGVAHVPFVAALFVFSALVLLVFGAAPHDSFAPLSRDLILAALASAVAGLGLGRLERVQRVCIPKQDRQLLVDRRARLEFFKNRLEKTSGATGVLIFLSLMERQVLVLADKSIASKVGDKEWQGVVDAIVNGVKAGDLGKGLVEGVGRCSAVVERHFPRKGGLKKNQLSDHLIVKE
ncbi:MAG: hypothetical protein V4498_05510 [candidate division FCPU426 bacterium]